MTKKNILNNGLDSTLFLRQPNLTGVINDIAKFCRKLRLTGHFFEKESNDNIDSVVKYPPQKNEGKETIKR